MKTCKNCKQIVNIETVTCPNCDEHEFKINAVKICALCGKVNEKKNKECELCGKSFSGKANDYEIATVMNLALKGEKEREKAVESEDKRTPREKYIAVKGEIEAGGNEERCAFFIPGELKEKPIVLLPSFEESEKVDVYLVLSNSEMPEGMKKINISKEEDINALNEKQAAHRKTSIAAFVLFWLNLAMVCAFGLKMVGSVLGFQIIVSSFGGNNAAGQLVITAMEATSGFGSYAYFIYPGLFGLIAVEVLLSLIFVRTKERKGKKVFLIIMQSVIFAFAIGAYLISFLMIQSANWQDIETGMILLATCAFAGMLVSIFYQYPKTIEKKEAKERQKLAQDQNQETASELVGLGYDIENEI